MAITAPPPPPTEITEAFGVHVLEALGGRQNFHWIVARRNERLILRRWGGSADDVAYETRLLGHVAALGWPVATPIAGPLIVGNHSWSLFPFLPGEAPSVADPQAEARARGCLLATFHAALAGLDDLGQRPGFRRGEVILGDEGIDRLLARHERDSPEEVSMLRWHLGRARARIAALRPHDRPDQLIHGDFTPWNLRFRDGHLTGILDFALAHRDHRVADFALTWRGKHDAVVSGYDEVAPLEPEEWALLTPVWWAHLIEGARVDLARGVRDHRWTIDHLLRRSPLMGADAAPYPG